MLNRSRCTVLLFVLFAPSLLRADIVILLSNRFIEWYTDRDSIDADFQIDHAGRIHSPKQDADLHIAGRSPHVMLPMVIEIKNARSFEDAVTFARNNEDRAPVRVTGAWRIWCEHGGDQLHDQGVEVPEAETSNPDHIFEIHPVTRFGEFDLRESLKPIEGVTPKDADRAFLKYEDIPSEITPAAAKTRIRTKMAGFNHVEFVLRLLSPSYPSADGAPFAMCSVHELDGELLVRKRRMAFPKGSQVEAAINAMQPGEGMHVMGIPRMNLKPVSWRVGNAQQNPDVLRWGFPYEIIVVAKMSDDVPDFPED